ncbi:hypothetical protein G3A_13950 [Bacillus sp. 17376]|uniref:Drug resistance transporter n=1 Tax=Mesobacillus boroniphilus JCM 21738 TaxID=1294265 RepID=W4RPH3_9BACI|nr:MFS transporter [Mesobacillus boroniphilus]ESU31913.1 hypothetical protein G3A_13950 [Bacillus sp. 17376]GAE45773.1 drug resistance transporter [Mesobacillus boroniphilus JCM 21738]
MLKYAILSVSLITVMAGAIIAPAVGSIAVAFPDASGFEINLLTSLHAAFMIPFAFVSGYLCRYFSKKTVLILGLVLYLVAGLGGGFATNMAFLLFTRALLGVSVGLLMPLSTTLVSDYYDGEERTSMMGLVSAATNLGAIIAIMVSGILAMQGWRAAFYVYGIAAIVMIFVVAFLPRKAPATIQKNASEKTFLPKAQIAKYSILIFLVFIVFYSIPSNMALFLRENSVTNTGISGVIIAACSLGGFLGGLTLIGLKRKIKSFYVPVQVMLLGIGFGLVVFTQPLVLMGIGVLILGFGYGSLVPIIFDGVSKAANGAQAMIAMAIVQSFIYLGQFSSPHIHRIVSTSFGDGSVNYSYTVMAVVLLIVGALLILKSLFQLKSVKGTEMPVPQKKSI